ncbi:MAG: sigma-54 dependent transcriptional regulator [Gammaproteobacteria bacterium]
MNQILIVEDEAVIRAALQRLLERHGYQAIEAGGLSQALELLAAQPPDLIIADLRLPDGTGTELIGRADEVPVLIMTSYASVRSAVESMKAGAVDYIAKPFDHDEMLLLVKRVLRQRALEKNHALLKSELSHHYPVAGMVGRCPAMQAAFERVHRVAPTDATVLILGESGTGKELIARALHEHSNRRERPFVTVNCAAIPDGLIESELFGHEKGAFTGAVDRRHGLVEAANGGTLFLDEIGELPAAAQSRLLRVLQEGEIRRVGADQPRHVDIRLIAATHRNLARQVENGQFRDDLYFRLRVVEIGLPPLRERGKDLEDLAAFLLDKACRRLNRSRLQFAGASLRCLQAHAWPGNVRELENAIERAVILCDGDTVTPDLLGIDNGNASGDNRAGDGRPELSLDQYFIRFVRQNERTMTETELARRLGISRKTLWERRQRLGIPRRRELS